MPRYRLLCVKYLINDSDCWDACDDSENEVNKLSVFMVPAGIIWIIIILENSKLSKLVIILLTSLADFSDWPKLGIRYGLLFNSVFFSLDNSVLRVLWLPKLPELPVGVVISVSLLLSRILML